jgi:hypothetical protein
MYQEQVSLGKGLAADARAVGPNRAWAAAELPHLVVLEGVANAETRRDAGSDNTQNTVC